jgi:hypothetical protein
MNPSSILPPPPLSPPKPVRAREQWLACRPAGGGGTVACLLTGGRRLPEGERAVVERSRGDVLKQEPGPVNPRLCINERRCSGSLSWMPTGSDPAIAGIGESRGTSFLMLGFQRFGDPFISLSIRFLLTLIQTISSYSCGRNSRSKQNSSRLSGPDLKNRTRSIPKL